MKAGAGVGEGRRRREFGVSFEGENIRVRRDSFLNIQSGGEQR